MNIPAAGVAHQAGTAASATIPTTSVLDEQLQGPRPRQPLRRRHQLLPEHRRREPGAHGHGQRAARRATTSSSGSPDHHPPRPALSRAPILPEALIVSNSRTIPDTGDGVAGAALELGEPLGEDDAPGRLDEREVRERLREVAEVVPGARRRTPRRTARAARRPAAAARTGRGRRWCSPMADSADTSQNEQIEERALLAATGRRRSRRCGTAGRSRPR